MPTLSRKAGGLLTSVSRLAQAVAKLPETDVYVFGAADEYTEDDKDDWGTLNIEALPVKGPTSFGYSPLLIKKLQDVSPDIGHTEGLWIYTSVAIRKWSRMTQSPYLVSPHGMLDRWAVKNSGLKKKIAALAFEKAHLNNASCLHALCEAEAKAIRDYGITGPVGIVPNGIDLPDDFGEGEEPAWENEVTQGRKVLLYLGRIHRKKGLVPLVEAWNHISKEGKNNEWILVIAGWEQEGHQNELKGILSESSRKSVFFVGPQFGKDKERCYRRADAYVLPSFSEGLPMTVLEAWAYNLPVVMTDFCNLPEGFNAEAAIHAEPETRSLFKSLNELFEMSHEDRTGLGFNGRQLVQNKFTWPIIAKDMFNIYKWSRGGDRPDCIWEN